MSRIVVPRADNPIVSLVMTSYGKVDMTLATLAAFAANTPPIFELILVESDSPERAADVIGERVEGIDLVRCENHGFGHAQNLGIARARGDRICILSNDLMPEPGWLEPLLEHFASPEVGVVVPMLLDPDRSLQEAGVVMGSDGYPWRWGQGLAVDAAEVNFPRTVDYGTGCMLVRAEALRASGGFRPEYGLGYLEDADLCLTIRDLGWRAVYEPRARLVHALHGTFGQERAHRLSAVNRPKLLARWGRVLSNRPPLREADLHPDFIIRARDALATHRVLLVAHDVGWVDVVQELRALLPDAALTVLLIGEVAGPAPEHLRSRGIEVAASSDPARWLADRRGHADLVWVLDSEAMTRLGEDLSSSQRQAAWIYRMTMPPREESQGGFASPPPPLVLLASSTLAGLAVRAFPDAQVFPEDVPVTTLLAAAGILGEGVRVQERPSTGG